MHPDASPRFNLTFPAYFGSDAGAQHLALTETGPGYERATRNLLERFLQRGDLFVDVGAHWGLFTLQAATHPAGDIHVVAFEPELMNAVVLTENVVKNKVTDVVTVLCAACGRDDSVEPLILNSTMGHSIRGVGLPAAAMHGPSKWVAVVTLDRALSALQQHAARRIVLKLDAEGFEAEIVAGARALVQSGRVALIIWEWGPAFNDGREREAARQMVAFLDAHGFSHLQPSDNLGDGPMRRFDVDAGTLGNVFSFGPQASDLNF
jgi:FkbM family methyltransferase